MKASNFLNLFMTLITKVLKNTSTQLSKKNLPDNIHEWSMNNCNFMSAEVIKYNKLF
jgi:hypothetical protein